MAYGSSKISAILLLGGLALTAGLKADAGRPAPPPPPPPQHEGRPAPECFLAQLGLSKEEKDKLKALRRARRDKHRPLCHSLADAREDMKDLLADPTQGKDYEKKLRDMNDKLLQLELEEGKVCFDGMLEVRSVLSASQLKQLIQLHKERGECSARPCCHHHDLMIPSCHKPGHL